MTTKRSFSESPISLARRKAPGAPSFSSFTSQAALVQVGSPSALAAALLALARNRASKRPLSRTQRIRARARAPSVPGLLGSQRQAFAAVLEKRGAPTAILTRPEVSRSVRLG